MKLKNSYFYTLRENAKDEDSTSGNLLVRSGMIKKVSSGIYMYLPLGLKVLDNITKETAFSNPYFIKIGIPIIKIISLTISSTILDTTWGIIFCLPKK